jgi:hypothetical protein
MHTRLDNSNGALKLPRVPGLGIETEPRLPRSQRDQDGLAGNAGLSLILPRVAGEGDHPKDGGGGGQSRRLV